MTRRKVKIASLQIGPFCPQGGIVIIAHNIGSSRNCSLMSLVIEGGDKKITFSIGAPCCRDEKCT